MTARGVRLLWATIRAMGWGVAAGLMVGACHGCCTPQPARVDPKKRAAYLDQTAVISSFAIWGGCPTNLAQQHNADSEFMTRGGQ